MMKKKQCPVASRFPLFMDTWKVTKISDNDKSGVTLVDNLRPYE